MNNNEIIDIINTINNQKLNTIDAQEINIEEKMYVYALDTFNKLVDDIFLHNEGDHPELIKSDLDNRVDTTEVLLYNTLIEMIKIDICSEKEVAMIDELFNCFEYLYDITEYPECDELQEIYGHLVYGSDRYWSMLEKLATVGLGPLAC